MASIRILVVDDHEMVRRGICNLLGTEEDLNVVGQATSGYEAVQKAEECQPDVVLLDINIPELNGLMAAPLIKRLAPKAEILMVTNHDDPFFVREAFGVGALGFLVKRDRANDLIGAVRQVHSKNRFVSRNLSLTQRSQEENAN